jgi:hypothetical protein
MHYAEPITNRHKLHQGDFMPQSACLPTFEDVNLWPKLNQEQGDQLVREALEFVYGGLPSDEPLDQTARYLSLRLLGTVSAADLTAAYELWKLDHDIRTGEDLTYLLDVPNTDESRAHELSVAASNLQASINDILTMAGVRK